MDDDAALIARLREADRNSVQRTLGSGIFGEAADRIEALTRPTVGDEQLLREALEAMQQAHETLTCQGFGAHTVTVSGLNDAIAKIDAALARRPLVEGEE